MKNQKEVTELNAEELMTVNGGAGAAAAVGAVFGAGVAWNLGVVAGTAIYAGYSAATNGGSYGSNFIDAMDTNSSLLLNPAEIIK
ncbi:MAG: hypothetical protein INR69_02740 [Mucilaginibacter polytrichastri]|nr:hypothetical protein [Mucilaginibacter polytrichastri]